jgi:hypothetical protein
VNFILEIRFFLSFGNISSNLESSVRTLFRGENWNNFCTLFIRDGNWIKFCTIFRGGNWNNFCTLLLGMETRSSFVQIFLEVDFNFLAILIFLHFLGVKRQILFNATIN